MSFMYQLLFIPFQQGCMGFEEVQVSRPVLAYNNRVKGTVCLDTMATFNNLSPTRNDLTPPRNYRKADPSDVPSMNTILLEGAKNNEVGRPASPFKNEDDSKSTSIINLQNESQTKKDGAALKGRIFFGSSFRKKATNKKEHDSPEIAAINLEEQDGATPSQKLEDDFGSPIYKLKYDEQDLNKTPERSINHSRVTSEYSLLRHTSQTSPTFNLAQEDTSPGKNPNKGQSENSQIDLLDTKNNIGNKRAKNLKLNILKRQESTHIKGADVTEPEMVFQLDTKDDSAKIPLQGGTTIQEIPQAESLLYKVQDTPSAENQETKDTKIALFEVKKKLGAKSGKSPKQPEKKIETKLAEPSEQEISILKLDVESKAVKSSTEGNGPIKESLENDSVKIKEPEMKVNKQDTVNESITGSKPDFSTVKDNPRFKSLKSFKWEAKEDETKKAKIPESNVVIAQPIAQAEIIKSPIQIDNAVKENLTKDPVEDKEPKIEGIKQDAGNKNSKDSKLDSSPAKKNPQIKTLKSFKWEAKEDETKKAKITESNVAVPQPSDQAEVTKSSIQENSVTKENLTDSSVKDKEPKIESLKQDIVNEGSKLDSSPAKNNSQVKSVKSFKWGGKEDDTKKAKIPEPNLAIPQLNAQAEIIKSPIQVDNVIKENPTKDLAKDKEPKTESLKQDIENENSKGSKLDSSPAKKIPQVKSAKSFKWEGKEDDTKKAKIPESIVVTSQPGVQAEIIKNPIQVDNTIKEISTKDLSKDKEPKIESIKQDIENKNSKGSKPDSSTAKSNPPIKSMKSFKWEEKEAEMKKTTVPKAEVTVFQLGAHDEEAKSPQRDTPISPINQENESLMSGPDAKIPKFRLLFDPSGPKKETVQKGETKLNLDDKTVISPKLEMPTSTTNLNNENPKTLKSKKTLDSKLIKKLDPEITIFKLGEEEDAQSPQKDAESPLIDSKSGSPTKTGDVVIEPFRMFFNPTKKKGQ